MVVQSRIPFTNLEEGEDGREAGWEEILKINSRKDSDVSGSGDCVSRNRE